VSFDRRDVRRGMDVYTLDNVYLGTVLWVRGRDAASADGAIGHSGPAPRGSAVSGELLGPMPTAQLGNAGPREQSAGRAYASRGAVARRLTGADRMVVVRMPLGTDFREPWPRVRQVAIDLVQMVSLERVVLRVTAADLSLDRG